MPVHIQDDDLHAPQGTQDFERGTRAAAAVLASGVTAAFCYNDSIALGLMAQVQRAGAHVPDDISVIGLDDIDMARDWTPALTTVRQPKYEMGRAAAMYLMQSPLPGHDTVRPLLLPCDLVVRASTAPLTAAPGSHTEASA
jgi:DNA-binding LacI/PurR family transcriptional regulator